MSMSVIQNDDPHAVVVRHICDWCGEEIEDVYYDLFSEEVCEQCMEERRRTV